MDDFLSFAESQFEGHEPDLTGLIDYTKLSIQELTELHIDAVQKLMGTGEALMPVRGELMDADSVRRACRAELNRRRNGG